MEMQGVNSSMLTHVGHDPVTNRLTVQFKNGNVYHYDGVTPEEHAALLQAPSIGAHFGAHIRNSKAASRG